MQLNQVLPIIISIILLNNDGNSVEIAQYRIIGGAETVIEKHPYIVSISRDNKHICGGSIISQNHILSAAHCFYDDKEHLTLADYHILAGTTNIKIGSDKNSQLYDISNITIHPDYNADNDDNDISLLKLSTNITFSDSVQAINVPDVNCKLQTNDTVYVCGWGQTKLNETLPSDVLQTVKVTVIDRDSCEKSYSDLRNVSNNMICAGDRTRSRDACFGDSGGPLIFSQYDKKKKESELHVVGIVSWGYKCGDVKYPGVYTNVAKYYNWINNLMV